MELPKKAISEFQQIYLEETGVNINEGCSKSLGSKLLGLFSLICSDSDNQKDEDI